MCNFFFREFYKETARASVILAAAMLEQGVSNFIQAYLVPVSSGDDNLFNGPNAPLASFSAKIDMAYRVGLISPKMCRDLHLIRKIRNEFAHNVTGCSFENMSVRSRVVELTRSSGLLQRSPSMKKTCKTPRDEFELVVSWMLWYLSEEVEKIKSVEPKGLEFGYTLVMKASE